MMRKTEKQGYTRGVRRQLDDGIEIARWSTRGGAHWCSLREHMHPTMGVHWSYEGDGSGGGYTQLEGFDRLRAFGAIAHKMERAGDVDSQRMLLEFNVAEVDVEQAKASFASQLDSFLVTAQWLGVPTTFFAGRVEEVARAYGDSEERVDVLKCAGLKANLLYLLRQPGAAAWVGTQLAGVERTPSVTQADSLGLRLIARLREEAADIAFQDYSFGDVVVEDADGWEAVTSTYPGKTFSRKVYIQPEDGDGPTETVSFSVKFEGVSVVPSDVSALLMSSGQEIGFMPSPDDGLPVPGMD